MPRIDEIEEAKRERQRQQARERARRWRERNPEKVREAQRRWREANRESVNELNRGWRADNPEKYRDAQARWRKANRARLAAYFRKWARENPEANRERKRRYRERVRAIRRHWPAMGELRKAALLANDVYAAVHHAVPAELPAWLRDDVISEVVLSILEGSAAIENAAAGAKAALRRHRNELYRNLSLNQPAFEGGPDRIDLLRAEEMEEAENEY